MPRLISRLLVFLGIVVLALLAWNLRWGRGNDPVDPKENLSSQRLSRGGDVRGGPYIPQPGIDPALKELFLKIRDWPRPGLSAAWAGRLATAVGSGNRDEYMPALYELFGSELSREEVAVILKNYLGAKNQEVRYTAAEMLMQLGDKSAVPVLISMLSDSRAKDFWPRAAGLLAQFQIEEAGPLVAQLYATTKAPGFEESAYRLKMTQVIPIVQQAVATTGFFPMDAYAMAYLGNKSFEGVLKKIVEDPNNGALQVRDKGAAAWSLYQLTGNAAYLSQLIEIAAPFQTSHTTGPGSTDTDLYWGQQDAFRYAAGEDSPGVRQLMEKALNAPNKDAAAVAVVSLILVQGESPVAEEVLIKGAESHRFDQSLLLNVASAKPGRVRSYVLGQAANYSPADLDKYFSPQYPKPVETWIYEFIPSWDYQK